MNADFLPALSEVAWLTSELVSIPSINTSLTDACEAEIGQFVEEYLRRLGADISRVEVMPGRANIIGSLRGDRGGPILALVSHMDTVGTDSWFVGDPFTPRIDGDRLYGRGASDNKGSLAAMLLTMANLAKVRLAGDVMLVATVDEEGEMRGIHRLIAAGFRADAAIVGEPTSLQVGVAHNGVVRWRITVKGRSAHTSVPETGLNAIYAMSMLCAHIRDTIVPACDGRRHSLTGRGATSVTMICGGQAPNIVPDRCTATIDRRLLPGEEPHATWREYNSQLQLAMKMCAGYSLAIEEPFYVSAAMEVATKEPVVRSLKYGCQMSGQSDGHLVGLPFGTEAGALSRAGIPSTVFGPGDINQAHTGDEFISLARIQSAVAILTTASLHFSSTVDHLGGANLT